MEQKIEYGLKDRILHYYLLYRNKVHAWAACGVGIAILVISFFSNRSISRDYIAARDAFQNWKDAPTDEKLALVMKQSVRKVPGLEQALEAEIAQTYLAQGLPSMGMKEAMRSVSRLHEISPLHAQFSQDTLLIETQKFQEALEGAVSLKEEMEKTFDSGLWKGRRMKGGSALYVCNLLRIAFLQKQLENRAGELAAWEEIRGLIELEGKTSAAAQFLKNHFGSDEFGLTDFISQRERAIVQ